MKPKTKASRARPTAEASSQHSSPQAQIVIRKRILLVDDHPMMRVGVTTLINAEPDLEVCAQASNAEEALSEIPRCLPDLVMTDMTMPGRGGLELIKDVQTLYPDLPILVVSMHDETLHAERVLRAGARGYIMKESGGEKLLAAIRQVLNGLVFVSEKMSVRIVGNLSNRKPRGSTSPIEQLSDREFEIFQLLGQGKNSREIARQLHLSPKTVDVHRANIKQKLELTDMTALVRHAVRWVESEGVG